MAKCVFCGKEYGSPKGLTLVRLDGSINHLCSSKCRKNMLMKRRKTRWVSKDLKKKVVEKQTKEVEKVEKVEETGEKVEISRRQATKLKEMKSL